MSKLNLYNFNLRNIIKYLSERIGIDLEYFLVNSFWTTLIQVTNIILSLILTIFLARFTTQENFGNYNFIISIITLLSIISMPGFGIILIKHVSKGKDGLYDEIFKIRLIWSLLGVPLLLLIGIYYYFNNQLVGISLLLTSIFFPFLYAPNNWVKLLEGKKRFDSVAKKSIFLIIIRTLTIIIAAILGSGNLIPILAAFLVTNSIFEMFYYFKSKKFLTNNKIVKNWKENGYKLTFVEFTYSIYYQADKIIIGVILGPVELAIYIIATSVVYQISGSITQILRIIYPKIFHMDSQLLIKTLKKFIPKFTILMLLFSLLILFILPIIIPSLFSESYSGSIFYAQIYTFVIPLTVITSITDPVLMALNKENLLFRIRVIGIIIVLLLYLLLIPLLGIFGAIISSIAYYMILMSLQLIYILKKSY